MLQSASISEQQRRRPVRLPIFVIEHAPGGSAARQLDAWRLRYESIDVAETAQQDAARLMEAHGEQIFRPYGPGLTMTPAEVASAVGHLRIYEVMAKRRLGRACIVEGCAELSAGFPQVLQSKALLESDWQVLLLAHRSSRRRRAASGATPSLWRKQVAAGHGIARPAEFPSGATACLVTAEAAQKLRRIAWPIRLPAAVVVAHARMTGLDVRIVTPCLVQPPAPAVDGDDGDLQDALKDAFYAPPVVDLMNRVCSPCASPGAWSVYPASAVDPAPKGVELRSMSLRPRREHAGGAMAEFAGTATDLWRYLRFRHRALGAAIVAARDGVANRLRRAAIWLLGVHWVPSSPGAEPLAPSPRPIPFRTPAGATVEPRPKIAVVVPTVNRRQLVAATLAAVRSQTLEPHRLIVVDDGSSDGTAEAVRQQFAAGGFPFDTDLVVQERNRGAPAARNAGLARAGDCDFVWFLDSDDFPPRNFLEKTASSLQESPEAVAASTDRVIRTRGHAWFSSLRTLRPEPRPWFFEHGTVVGSCTLFRTSVVRQLGGFDEALPTSHDTALFMRVAGVGPWLHAAGSPVQFLQRDFHAHLKYGYDDWERRVAEIQEACLLDPGVDAAVSGELRRRVLCNRWYTAGRQLAEQGRWREAADCFRRCLAWKRRFARAWFYLLASNVGVFRQAKAGMDSEPRSSRPAAAHPRDTRPSNST